MNTVARGLARFDRESRRNQGREWLAALLHEESGQDIVEYALLGAVVGIAAVVVWQQLVVTIGEVYGETVAQAPAGEVQNLSSCMPGPDGTGC